MNEAEINGRVFYAARLTGKRPTGLGDIPGLAGIHLPSATGGERLVLFVDAYTDVLFKDALPRVNQ